ncbi:MAG: diacylglycerol kinase (ATP) [Bradymonadia bacterium]|jgi:diacylglycerol kinase (ATP)
MRYPTPFETAPIASALVVLNANARRLRQRRTLRRLERTLNHLPGPRFLQSRTAEKARAAIANSPADLLVVGGGDGAINLALNALPPVAPRLALLPGGTANDLARALNLPLSPRQAARHALTAPRHLDLLTVNGTRFITTGGVGVPEAVARASNRTKQCALARVLGHRLYDCVAARTILAANRRPVDIAYTDVEGRARSLSTRCFGVLATNVGRVAGDLRLCESTFDDGIFEICVLADDSRMGLLQTLLTVSTGGRVGPDKLLILKARDAIIQTPHCGFFGDGEGLGQSDRFDIRLEHRAVAIAGGVA